MQTSVQRATIAVVVTQFYPYCYWNGPAPGMIFTLGRPSFAEPLHAYSVSQ